MAGLKQARPKQIHIHKKVCKRKHKLTAGPTAALLVSNGSINVGASLTPTSSLTLSALLVRHTCGIVRIAKSLVIK